MQILRFSGQPLPVIYYTYYTPESSSIPAIAAKEHALGRQLLRAGLAREFQISYTPEVLEESLIYGLHGKPALRDYPGVHFNITHCAGLAACAFSDQKVGIDAEMPGYFADILIKRALSAPEKEILQGKGATLPLLQEWFYRFWTLKESYVKKSGIGVDTDLTAFSFSFPEEPMRGEKFLQQEAVPIVSTPTAEKKTALPGGAAPASAAAVLNDPAADAGRILVTPVTCSDSTVRCLQTRLGHGQILSLCW